VTFDADSRLRFLRQIPQRRVSGHAANPTVSFRRGSVVRITADRSMAVYADGEPIGALPATVTIRPRALSVLVPER
jgi:diacylglycerol kinase family enzyme